MTAVSRDSPGTRVVDVEEIQRRAAVLTDFEVREISQTGLRIEELMGRPQDVEWAYDAEQLWIVQARPITGLPASGF
jgi:pyruvate,water dikinase